MHDLLVNAQPPFLAASPVVALWQSIWPYVMMLLGFSVIVFVHELGHFLAAKWAGVKVERFAVGFGRELFGFTRGETRYSFNVLPLGGYVKMLGQEDFDDKAKELQFNADPRSFVNKPVGHRMIIVSAGVVMNVLLACLLFMIVFRIGMEAIGTSIAYVTPDSPAELAGLEPGDVIKEINGERIVEFREVFTAVMLAPTHEPIKFLVERNGQKKEFAVTPDYSNPESSREAKRLIVGISNGVTREILFVGPEMDPTREDHPHIGDMIVEVDGVAITDDNASEALNALVYAKGDVIVERKDLKDPKAEPRRVAVTIPPILAIYPTGSEGAISILGLSPLVSFNYVDPRGRAALAGIEPGDTILAWDDKPFPTRKSIARSIQDRADRDIYFTVQKRDGSLHREFIRPQRNKRGPATIHALCRQIPEKDQTQDGPKALFADLRPHGIAEKAGIDSGDVVLAIGGKTNPTSSEINREIRSGADRQIPFTVRKADGTSLSGWLVPDAPGTIGAKYDLVADNLLRVSDIVATINDQPSSAAKSELSPGSLITSVNGQPVARWRDLIDSFRMNAGGTVELAYRDAGDQRHTAAFDVPHSIRTLLGVGPEARIVSIDGQRTVMIETSRGREPVAVGYRKGTRAALEALVGRTAVPVEFRRNPLSDIETASIDVTTEMVDPWLGRIALSANIDVAPETTILKGDNLSDALMIGLHKTYYFMLQVYKTMQRMIFTRSVGVENLSGPLGIIDVGGKIARTGYVEFIFFLAIISANLAVINFLPLPIVDGGLMVFLIIEKIKGSPVSLRVQIATQMIGLFLIIGAFLYVTFQDAMRLWG